MSLNKKLFFIVFQLLNNWKKVRIPISTYRLQCKAKNTALKSILNAVNVIDSLKHGCNFNIIVAIKLMSSLYKNYKLLIGNINRCAILQLVK